MTAYDEERYRTLFDRAPVGILYADERSTYLDANACICAMLGYSRDELVGKHATDIVAADEVAHIESALLDIQTPDGHRREWRFRRKDGSTFPADVIATTFPDGTLLAMIRDVTESRAREREMARLSRLYAALSQVNQAIVWAPTREQLFQKVCEALVEHGGFPMAWIAWQDRRTLMLRPVATCGDRDGFFDTLDVPADDGAEDSGPAGVAFRTGRASVCNDLREDPTLAPWRERLDRHGFRSCGAFPILVGGSVRGTLNVYGGHADIFHDKEVALLAEAAADVSFALDNFARDAARRQAERIALDEQQFADTMIESMPGIVYFYDASGRFRRWNRNFEVVSGYSAEEIVGMHPLDFFAGDDRERVEQRIATVFDTGEATVDAAFVAKDGSRTPYHFTGRRVQSEGQSCLIGVGVDISQRTRTEAALKDAELRFHTLFEQTPAGVVVIDPVTTTIVECNERAARQLGYTPEQFCRLELADIDVAQTPADTRRHTERILADGREQFETRQRTRSGEIREVLVSAQTIEMGGRTLVHCVFLDITEQKAAAADREQRERAEAADRLKSAFLATMSHELRTPLNSIIGFTGVLLQALAGPLNDEQRKQLEMVRTSARHLLALVNDVLDISKIEAGQIEMAHASFAVPRSIAKVVDIVSPAATKAGLALRTTIAPEVDVVVADERRFEQILLNLLGNAIKFTDRGEVVVEADVVRESPSADVPGDRPCLRVRVIDTGIGIRPEDLATLFQPFRQIDSGLSRKYEGTGLGLAICARLAQLMGGRVDVESRWGEGSTFVVTLPLEADPG